MTKKTIIWFRNDLRLSDNKVLDYAARNGGQILFLYIWDDNIGAAAKWFLCRALESFKQDIKQKYNAELVIKAGEALPILDNLVEKYAIDSLLWNRVYEPEAIARDTKIKQYFKDKGLAVKSFNSSLLFEPDKIKNGSGDYFKVFTPFWRRALLQIDDIEAPCSVPETLDLIKIDNVQETSSEILQLIAKKPFWALSWDDMYNISEEAAHDIADEFMDQKVQDYKRKRDFPAANNTSLLSPYLHCGLISAKQLYFKSIAFPDDNGVQCFLSEIGWREFSYHLLYHFPELPKRNFKAKFDSFTWVNNNELLEKWQKGMTGFPLIDAGMRQLWQTGWMHNRVRMVVASFLIKNLLIDWRIGQEWFWDCLIDADLAANSASWQWVAGTGADAAPYFRIFNPITQSQKFDANGEYIRKWVPEIAHLSNTEIHNPAVRDSYPEPIIDLKSSREKALAIYKEL